MSENKQEKKNLITLGTQLGGIVCGVLFFITALLLVFIGFWKTLLVVLLSGAGYMFGASSNFFTDLGRLLNRVIPVKNRQVIYTPEELERIKNAIDKQKPPESSERPS